MGSEMGLVQEGSDDGSDDGSHDDHFDGSHDPGHQCHLDCVEDADVCDEANCEACNNDCGHEGDHFGSDSGPSFMQVRVSNDPEEMKCYQDCLASDVCAGCGDLMCHAHCAGPDMGSEMGSYDGHHDMGSDMGSYDGHHDMGSDMGSYDGGSYEGGSDMGSEMGLVHEGSDDGSDDPEHQCHLDCVEDADVCDEAKCEACNNDCGHEGDHFGSDSGPSFMQVRVSNDPEE